MKCHSCGVDIDEKSEYCSECSNKTNKPCPKCKAEIDNTQKICKKCKFDAYPECFELKEIVCHNFAVCDDEKEPDKNCGQHKNEDTKKSTEGTQSRATDIVSTGATGKTQKKTNGNTQSEAIDKTPTGSTGKTQSGASNKTPTGATGKTLKEINGKTQSKATEKTPTGASGETPMGTNGKTQSGATYKTQTAPTGKTPKETNGKTQSEATDKTPMGATGKTPTRAAGKPKKKKPGKIPKVATGKTPTRAAGKPKEKQTGKIPKVATRISAKMTKGIKKTVKKVVEITKTTKTITEGTQKKATQNQSQNISNEENGEPKRRIDDLDSPDKKPRNSWDPRGRNLNTDLANGSQLENTSSQSTDTFEVQFNVFVTQELMADSIDGVLYIFFFSDGWFSKPNGPSLMRERIILGNLMNFKVDYRLDRKTCGKKLIYKYVIWKFNGIVESLKFFDRNYRTLNISDSRKGKVYQFDGIMRDHSETSSRFMQIFKKKDSSFESEFMQPNEAVLALQPFLSKLKMSPVEIGKRAEDVSVIIQSIFNGLHNAYKEEKFVADCSEELKKYLLNIIKEIEAARHSADPNEHVFLMAAAVTVFYLMYKHSIDLEEMEGVLFKCLCPVARPDQKENKTDCPEFNNLSRIFPILIETIREAFLEKVGNLMETSSKTDVFFCLPLLHFLNERYIPYQLPPDDVNHGDVIPVWWGIDKFNHNLQTFKYKEWDRRGNEVLRSIAPCFSLDYLLPRTFVATLNFDRLVHIDLRMIPVEASLGAICFYSNNTKHIEMEIESVLYKLPDILLHNTKDQSEAAIGTSYRSFIIALDTLDILYNGLSDKKSILCLRVMDVLLIAYDFLKKTKRPIHEKDRNRYQNYVKEIKDMLLKDLIVDREDYIFQVWNEVFHFKLPDGEIKSTFFDLMQKELDYKLGELLYEKPETSEKILNAYFEKFEIYHERVQAVLKKMASKAVEQGTNIEIAVSFDRSAKVRVAELLSQVLEKESGCDQNSDDHTCLEYSIGWRHFSTYLKLFYQEDLQGSLSDTSVKQIKKCIRVLKKACEQLVDGRIQIRDLELCAENKEQFISVLLALTDLKQHPTELLQILSYRKREYDMYLETKQLVQDFKHLCSRFYRGDIERLPNQILKLELGIQVFSDLCHVTAIGEMRNQQPVPTNNIFQLNEGEHKAMQTILDHKKSIPFLKLWEEHGKNLCKDKHKVDLNFIINDVWNQVDRSWNEFCSKLLIGEIKFSELLKYIPANDEHSFREELDFISRNQDKTWIDDRIQQYKRFDNLKQSLSGATAIMEVVEKFRVKGDFQLIQSVLDLEKDADKEMNTFDEKMIETCDILNGIQKSQAECLNTFCQCKPLIDWLRETMCSGLRELKVFVDLASISAGDGDMEIDKVNCLHAAITGYSPLIFNFGKEETVNSEDFIKLCRQVWKALESNPDLTTQLEDTKRNLGWLKTVKQSHGSVEVTSLFQVQAINASGSYYVGNLGKMASIKSPTLCEVLELRVSEYDGKELQKKKYKYEHLNDLQSRLMLVAGKAEQGKDDIDRFMLILDAAVRLANVYTRLVADGCVLFFQWYVQIICDPNRTACVHINFGTGDDRNTLKGRLDDTSSDVSSIIPKVAKFLEHCHNKWLEYIAQKREIFTLLNYFTIDQMVILQQELVKIGSDEEPSVLIYPMLSAIKKGCTKEILVKAMTEAKQEIEQKLAERQELNETKESDQPKSDDVKAEKIRKFLEELEKSYPIELAREALKHHDPDDIDEAFDWCLDNQDMSLTNDLKENEDSLEELPGKDTFIFRWTESNQTITSITKELIRRLGYTSSQSSIDTLLRALEGLWDQFLNSISSNVSDYLSVDHLGLILQKLADKETKTVERKLQPSFKEGEPNLVICLQNEIYITVLSLYSHEDDKPLPQSDEVLMCSPKTTLDMVEIFWRRALLGKNNKIYCLANADLLNYDVSDRAERTLENLLKVAEAIPYRLVVICSKENENKSRLVAALDKYRQPELAVNTQTVKTFLHNKMMAEALDEEEARASIVDFEKSTVRVVKSSRAGVGKTLYSKRMVEELDSKFEQRERHSYVTIPLYETAINIDSVIDILLNLLKETFLPEMNEPRIFHFDIYNVVQDGVDAFLFQLLVLGCLLHSTGYVWRKLPRDYYIIETMRPATSKGKSVHPCLDMLPYVTCRAPQETLEILEGTNKPDDYSKNDRLFDTKEFETPTFQRPYQYLKRFDANQNVNDVVPENIEGNEKECIKILLNHCGIRDPSWSEVRHFAGFLNTQLEDFSNSVFCTLDIVNEDLPEFSKFVLKFLIQMSRDFSTRSLNMSEESCENQTEQETVNEITPYTMRKTWETSPHPYIFFNTDQTMTFFGFNVQRSTGNLIDLQSREVLEENIMQIPLFDALVRNQVRLDENFDELPRDNKIERIRRVMGITDNTTDPDPTYELTTDNVKKILAIYMRFKCDIPVIIMGETGCGKTRLIKFLCALQHPAGVKVENMILMKVHGGTKVSDIRRKVQKAEEIAKMNETEHPFVDTVLFFDEANTTEAIGAIKEIMCDKSLDGKPISLHQKLKIVAACNPYRKHSEELIQKLEQAGLGYHVDADKSNDKLGRVPMRRLVYRVQPLPQSMLPLVWDFGQLNTEVEEMYIRQMVLRYKNRELLPDLQDIEDVVSKILTVSQDFMRDQKDECSFVSLRDVERVLEVMCWFYSRREDSHLLFDELKRRESDKNEHRIDDVTRSLVLALGVCYHSCLKNRDKYREAVANHFTSPLNLPGGADQMKQEIINCQTLFLDHMKLTKNIAKNQALKENVQLAPNIAKNQALKENVFMMIVCIELRIPMFLVGKPGSSKSLAKTIVADAMQGNAAHTDFFKQFKEAQMVSYQCSPLSVAEGITGTFRQCGAYQKGKNLDRFVSVVVLDEIGLAEDSPRMPLKALHPLLEDGCPDNEDPEPYKKVAFIGISNWALDPAKMNRGILVQREIPDIKELKESAEGICSTDKEVLTQVGPFIEKIAESYLEVFKDASTKMREFFGLRDFYSLIKMLYALIAKSRDKPSWMQLKYCILRNFGGLESVDPVKIFYDKLKIFVSDHEQRRKSDPKCISAEMIKACLMGQESGSDRYLLLLVENYGALLVLEQTILQIKDAVTIFGSSFPNDQEYTQVCRNINKIKVCMETGSTVILLNLENLYESLYDALNQYYVEFGGGRYVDLGLGSHRVKCRVHKNFRLIVVAEKHTVYENFPIPLINRLEKHHVSLKTILTSAQLELSKRLFLWAKQFCEKGIKAYQRKNVKLEDCFMGYHDDACATIIQHCTDEFDLDNEKQTIENNPEHAEKVLAKGKSLLLWCATPASVWRQDQKTFSGYFEEQHHDSLVDYLHFKLKEEKNGDVYAQITTHSKLLTLADVKQFCTFIDIERQNIKLLTLQSFDTEQQFIRQIRSCIDQKDDKNMLLIVQCDSGDENSELIACARYNVQSELKQQSGGIHVVFIIQLPSIAGGCFSGFQCGFWQSVHLDELKQPPNAIPQIANIRGKSVGLLLAATDTTCSEPNRHFDMSFLIKRCMQRALTKVKDPADIKSRATDRLCTVFNRLTGSDGEITFLSGFAEHLKCMLVDKEKEGSNSLTHWLSNEASRTENIIRAGTFRRFALNCMETKLIPMLTGILAFIDTNNNIDILASDDEWKHKMWISMFNQTEFTQFRYSSIISPSANPELQSKKELNEIPVKYTAPEGKMFSSVMPFSWLIFQHIDNAFNNIVDKNREPISKENAINLVIETSDFLAKVNLGQQFSDVEGNSVESVLQAYLHDFVCMIYAFQNEEEIKLVGQSIDLGCRLLLGDIRNKLLPSLIGFHVAYILQRTRLKNFSYMVNVCPTIDKKIVDFKRKYPSNSLVTDEEITLDILALHVIVSDMEPKKDDLNQLDTRTHWIRKICDYRPIFDRIFDNFKENEKQNELVFGYGRRCTDEIESARIQWTKALVVKLFIEHVCTSGKDDIDIDRCMPLWQRLTKVGAGIKTVDALKKLEDFLQICNKRIIKQKFGHQSACQHCEIKIEDCVPVKLPCDHMICPKCYHDSRNNENKCPICRTQYLQSYDPEKCDNEKEVKLYKDYRSRCNSFFMAVISQVYFADGSPPSEDVVDKILSYIVGEVGKEGIYITKELIIFNDSFDPTPVVRSFFLQQLIQTSDNGSYRYLQKFFDKLEQFATPNTQQISLDSQKMDEDQIKQSHFMTELCLLVLHCMEDSLHQTYDSSGSSEVEATTRFLNESTALGNYPLANMTLLTRIDNLSKIKFSLNKVAKHLHKLTLNGTDQGLTIDKDTEEMLYAAVRLCNSFGKNAWPRRFCVKQLCKCYGIESFEAIRKSNFEFRKCVILSDLKENEREECHDRYIVLGKEYVELRDIITKTAISKDDKDLRSFLERTGKDWKTRIKLLLALYREITMKNVYVENLKQIPAKNVEYICSVVSGYPIIKCKEDETKTETWEDETKTETGEDKTKTETQENETKTETQVDETKTETQEDETKTETIRRILHNNLWRVPGNIEKGMNLADQNIFCLLTHYFILLMELPVEKTLTIPLKNIALSPSEMKNSFLPTMPEDQIAMILEAIRNEKYNYLRGGELYECPNGHPYILGDCGKPWLVVKCLTCGADIGGISHELLHTNKKVDKTREDNGHNLGEASILDVPGAERRLQKTSCIILRLLTHMSMYIGANMDLQATCQMITPKIEDNDVANFLLNHIKHDLECLYCIFNKSKDDILVLVHFLLNNLMDTPTDANITERSQENVCTLMTKDAREKWENYFDEQFIIPVTKDIDSILERQNKIILDDKRLGSDPLLQILSEMHEESEAFSIDELESNPALWKYRAMITVNQFHKYLETTGTDELLILKLFMKNEYVLRAIRFIPNIIRLQKLLIQKYSRRLFKDDAMKMTVGTIKKSMSQESKSEEFSSLVQEFAEAWTCVRHSLKSFCFKAGNVYKKLDKTYVSMDITDKTSIVYLLPTHRDEGLCSYALLLFLLKEQISFLEEYCKLSKVRFSTLPSVQLKDLSTAHLISFHPDKDLLPMVLANCDYSLTVGQETTLEFNFKNLERQIMDRFLFSKSVFKNIQEIETMVYRLEYTNGQILQNLYKKEEQERLNPALINQISEDMKQMLLPDICDILDKLDIAISFILPISLDPDQLLYNFMTQTLQIENPFPCAKAHQSVKCKNILSLWMTLAKERTKQLAKYEQDTFPGVSDAAKTQLDESKTKALQDILDKMPPDHIEAVMDILFEFIVLKIDIPQNVDDEDYIDIYNVSLRDGLLAYRDVCPFKGELNDFSMDAVKRLFLNDDIGKVRVTVANSVPVWNLLHTAFSATGNQRR